ncbi:hypothetical protein ACFOU2_09625 [Bacillus songklensis]|uniref:Uncharacterized protein n=1 Tax=Bacillus songklensis TaxID=1069116 RepID=A0ABV8B295_9BACI
MPSYFTLTLDTTGPANPSLSINAGATYATAQLVDLAIGTSDGATTGYQMKIWGDVDTAYDTNVQATEAASSWITFSTSKQVKLSAGDGAKTINVKIRDDVFNESAQASDSINLDTTRPVVTISGPDVAKISEVSGKDAASFSFTVDSAFVEYKVKVVSSSGSAENTGTQIGTTNGSTNMSGTAGNYAASTAINCTIDASDLKAASAGDGAKVIKVFVKDAAGNWSV